MSTVVREHFSQIRQRVGGVRWFDGSPRELLEHCPPAPDAPHVPQGYGDYELIDVGRERWRLRSGRPVAYFMYTEDKKDPRAPWEAVWLEDGYYG